MGVFFRGLREALVAVDVMSLRRLAGLSAPGDVAALSDRVSSLGTKHKIIRDASTPRFTVPDYPRLPSLPSAKRVGVRRE
jgi:hypothetical protein